MTTLNVAELTTDLQAAGLAPVVLDEATDFAEIDSANADKPEIVSPTDNIPEKAGAEAPTPAPVINRLPRLTPLENSLIDLELATRDVARSLRRTQSMTGDVERQRAAITEAREAVTRAMAENGDFDAATRAFKSANNKLDRLIDTREGLLKTAREKMLELRGVLDALDDELATLEAE